MRSIAVKILAITPMNVDDDELARRQARYDRFSPEGLTVRLENIGTGSDIPVALNTRDDIEASENAIIERFRGLDPTGYDAFLPDCALDPAIDVPGVELARPIYGITKLTAHHLVGLGYLLGAAARNQAIADELDRKLTVYGLGHAGLTDVLGLSVEDIADDARWAAATDALLGSSTAGAIINGCSAVDVHPAAGGPALVDPTATALRLLGVAGSLGGRR
jgi:Asp/Glu/hydantoin racemase